MYIDAGHHNLGIHRPTVTILLILNRHLVENQLTVNRDRDENLNVPVT